MRYFKWLYWLFCTSSLFLNPYDTYCLRLSLLFLYHRFANIHPKSYLFWVFVYFCLPCYNIRLFHYHFCYGIFAILHHFKCITWFRFQIKKSQSRVIWSTCDYWIVTISTTGIHCLTNSFFSFQLFFTAECPSNLLITLPVVTSQMNTCLSPPQDANLPLSDVLLSIISFFSSLTFECPGLHSCVDSHKILLGSLFLDSKGSPLYLESLTYNILHFLSFSRFLLSLPLTIELHYVYWPLMALHCCIYLVWQWIYWFYTLHSTLLFFFFFFHFFHSFTFSWQISHFLLQ